MTPAQVPPPGGGATPWPRMRRSLSIEPVAEQGESLFPSVVIGDPVRGKYFKVGWPLSGLLLLWNEVDSAPQAVAAMQSSYGKGVSEQEIAQAADFLIKNELSETDDKGGWQRYRQTAQGTRHGIAKTLMHNYLFFRIPLVRPDARLRSMLPHLRFAFEPAFWTLVAAIGATGLYLSTRQWSSVMEAFSQSLHFQQVFLFAAALFLLKAIHELGHALTTTYYGCRVPSMGIAFMLGAPVLYTDTTDSWRLSSHRQRLAIVFAGVAAECIVASLALLAWPMLPDGPLRQICFSFATVSIVMSLAVNLNPLMRFDGYFALSDYLQVPNLQSRAFALGTWRLREFLFGLKVPPPEHLPAGKRRTLIIYAYCVWVYRFFLYLGIAYVVYLMAGKAIGIVLGLFELVVFIAMPIWHELKTWWTLRSKIRVSPRAAFTGASLAGLLILAITPCLTTIESPGVLVAGNEQELHVPAPARLTNVAVSEGQSVKAGDLLFEAASPELDYKLRKAKLQARLLELRLSRLLANPQDHQQTVVLKREFKAAREKIAGIERERAALRVTAPFSGRIADLDPGLAAGMWVAQEQTLARITDTSHARVKAVVAETDLARVTEGARGVFVADEVDLPSVTVRLEKIAPASDGKVTEQVLADLHGGPVPSMSREREIHAREGWIDVSYNVEGLPSERLVRGVVRLDAQGQSPLSLLWRRVGRVLVREQGF